MLLPTTRDHIPGEGIPLAQEQKLLPWQVSTPCRASRLLASSSPVCQSQVPYLLANNLPEFFPMFRVQTPPIRVFFHIFISQHYTSCPEASTHASSPVKLEHRRTEAALAASGVAWTALRNHLYAEACPCADEPGCCAFVPECCARSTWLFRKLAVRRWQ